MKKEDALYIVNDDGLNLSSVTPELQAER